ncbi:MAG TPA: carboxypeptidase-like regulatory domain-containing protein [Bryobacteraceae bacterium]|nr:carboxypeptidase-like regulatory domain-containing protein [Bryobacteraceae bacterium]
MKFSLIAVFCFLSSLLYSQDFRGTIEGQVTDQSSSAIPGAAIKITNNQTGEAKDVKSNNQGYYSLPYLNPGNYTIEATASGFETLRQTEIALRVADKLNLPLRMAVGQMSQEVTITGQQEVLDTGSADRGLVFDPLKTEQLPLNGRQEYMLMALTPGVLFTQEQFGASGFSGTRGWDVNSSYKINGARPGENVFLLNGAPISDNGGTWDLAPNIEAVQEFKVMTNTYDAQYGHFGGGAVNTTIKSGGNAYHGDVFDYFRNSYMDANNFGNNYNGQPTPYHNQHQFGGVVGGPVRKNKDFFFASFEGWREVLPAPSTNTVPTADEIAGNFAATPYTIYDPLTSAPCTSATCTGTHVYVRQPFAGDVVPSSRINPVGAKILSYYPRPTIGGFQGNFNAPNVRDQYMYNQPIGRWDHNFGDKDKIYGLATFQHGTENRNSSGFPSPADSGNIQNARTDQNYIIGYTRILSPTAVFDARLSYARFTQSSPSQGDPTFLASNLGISNSVCAPTVPQCSAPVVSFGNSLGNLFGGGSNALVNWYSFNTWDFNPSITLTRGKHTFHVGFEWLYNARPSESDGYGTGLLSFGTGWTQHYSDQQSGTYDGNSVATALLGNPTSGQVDYNAQLYITRPFYSGYIQDDWKVTPKLTINWGMRYELQVPWKDRFNRVTRGFDYNVVNPDSAPVLAAWNAINAANPGTLPPAPANLYGSLIFAGVTGASPRIYQTDYTNVAPRLGMAYRIGDKTVLRAGGGVFYQYQSNNSNTQYGFSQTTSYNTSLTTGLTPSANGFTGPYSLANPFPLGIASPAGSSLGALTNVGNSFSYNNPSWRSQRTYQASIAIQRELPWHTNLEVAYAYNLQIFVPVSLNTDHISLANQNLGIANPSYLSRSVPNPFYGILPTTSSIGANSTISYGTLLQPDPLWNGGETQNYGMQVGHYRSDELQIKVERRVGGGENKGGVLTYVVSYTHGKQMQADHRTDNWNLAEPLDYEIDDGTKINSFAFSGIYDLPFGKGRAYLNGGNRLVNRLVGDWRADYILTYYSGFPIGIPGSYNFNCGPWNAPSQNENQWFNNNVASCYTLRPTNTLNPYQDRFSTIFRQAVPQLNAAVEKTIHVTERYRFSLRLEGFNVTNKAIRNPPDTTVTDVQFGQLGKNQYNFPRTLQIGGKFYF